MEFLSILLISISLSMDAFSLAIAYGTLGVEERFSKKIASMVGIFHFTMPILGMTVKYILTNTFSISFHFITSIIYFYLGVMLLLEAKEEKMTSPLLSLKDIFLFAFAVSIDSFTVGVALPRFTILGPISFAIASFSFTLLGLNMGQKISKVLGTSAPIFGGITFFILGFLNL